MIFHFTKSLRANTAILFSFAFAMCADRSLAADSPPSPAPSSDNATVQLNVESLRRGRLTVQAIPSRNSMCTTAESALITGEQILLPLLTNIIDQAGQSITTSSGKDNQVMNMWGHATTYYACKEHLYPHILRITSPVTTTSQPQPAFSADLEFFNSNDGSAIKLLPVKISYKAPVMNSRAFGVVLAISIQSPGSKGKLDFVLPLGFNRCGRVGADCEAKAKDIDSPKPNTDAALLGNVSSLWEIFPSAQSDTNNVNTFRAGTDPRESQYVSTPINVVVQLVEISTYSKFEAFVGAFLTQQKSNIAKAIIERPAPTTSQDRIDAIKNRNDAAVAKLAYQMARLAYETAIRDGKSCPEIMQLWITLLGESSKAGIATSTKPPQCVQNMLN